MLQRDSAVKRSKKGRIFRKRSRTKHNCGHILEWSPRRLRGFGFVFHVFRLREVGAGLAGMAFLTVCSEPKTGGMSYSGILWVRLQRTDLEVAPGG